MELNQLRTFVTVAEEKHLTRASERLYTSQPAVSAQIKSLEEQLGVSLFERTPKGMLLTPAGERLLPKAQSILASASDLLADAKGMQDSIMGELKVGINSDSDFLKIPDVANRIAQKHPGVVLSLIQGMSANILLDVRNGRLDSGFFFGPCNVNGIHYETLQETATAVVAPKAWESKIADASFENLAAMPWVYTTKRCPFYLLKEQLFGTRGVSANKAVFVDTEDCIRAFIKSETGISLLREDDADKAEKEGWGCRWPGESPTIQLNIAVESKRSSEPAIQAWLSALREVWLPETKPTLKVV